MHSHGSPIIDPIHGHIPITRLESTIIATRQYQRLRFVLQNSAAYHTFPSSVHNRFSHSIGVMHICGKMFTSAIGNSRKDVIDEMIEQANSYFKCAGCFQPKSMIPVLETDLLSRFCKPDFAHSPLQGGEIIKYFDRSSSMRKDVHFSDYFVLSALWQSVRLGALLHDIGHLPMSHVFESALNDGKSDVELGQHLDREIQEKQLQYVDCLTPSRKKVFQALTDLDQDNKIEFHELRGLFIISRLFEGRDQYLQEKLTDYDKLVFRMTEDILISTNKVKKLKGEEFDGYKFLSLIHSFFANDFIDSDRFDYTDRDQVSCGVSHSKLDLDKLCQGMFINKVGHTYEISYDSKSLPAIEQFFHQRYLSYKNIVYHHSVTRMNAVLKIIIRRLLDLSVKGQLQEVTEALSDDGLWVKETTETGVKYHLMPDYFGTSASDEESGGIEVLFDDSWLRTLLLKCEKIIEGAKDASDDDNKNISRLEHLLPTFLYREVDNLYSVWKREEDYNLFLKRAAEQLIEKRAASAIPDDADQLIAKFNVAIDQSKDLWKQKLAAFYDAARKRIEADGVLLLMEETKLKIPRLSFDTSDFPVYYIYRSTSDEYKSIEHINPFNLPYFSCFSKIRENTPKFYMFLLGRNIKNSQKSIDMGIKIISNEFSKLMDEMLSTSHS